MGGAHLHLRALSLIYTVHGFTCRSSESRGRWFMTLGVEGSRCCVQTCQLCTPVDVLDLCSHLSVHRSFRPTGIFSRHFIASY